MDKLIDYIKYTTALAVGLLVYVPANFLPAGTWWERLTLIAVVGALALSALVGILFYARATTILVNTAPTPPGGTPPAYAPDGWLKLWGYLHLGLLATCFAVAGIFFAGYKVIGVVDTPSAECSAELTDSNGQPVTLTFPCANP